MQSEIRSFRRTARPAATLTRPAATVSTIRHSGHWAELLSDLTCLDDLIIETSGPAMTLSHRASLAGLSFRQDHGLLDGADFRLRLLLGRFAAILPDAPEQRGGDTAPAAIALEDRARQSLMVLRTPADAPATRFLMRTLMRAHGIAGPGILPMTPAQRARGGPFSDALADSIDDAFGQRVLDLARDVAADGSGLDPLDAAEIAGPLSLHPQRLRARGDAVGVGPDLVACALETLADNLVPLRIVCGNAGVVRCVDFSPFAARQAPGWQYIRGHGVSLRLDTRAIDSAWIFTRGDDPDKRRQLRVYDDSGQPVMMLSAQPDADGKDPAIWRALINALLS